jgi:hypothetical protein
MARVVRGVCTLLLEVSLRYSHVSLGMLLHELRTRESNDLDIFDVGSSLMQRCY